MAADAGAAAGPPRTRVPTLLREPVYMLDLATFKPPDELKIDLAACSDAAWGWKFPDGRPVDKGTHEFVRDVFSKSGIDTKGSYLPTNLHPMHTQNPRGGFHESFAEARLVMGGVMTELLEKTGLKATDIDILVTGSSMFCPTPSLSSMLINMFKMREDVMAFSLGGMGCANGVVALSLLRSLLQAHPGAKAVFVTGEILSSAFYQGENKNCLVSNAIFRMGAAACLLTSGRAHRAHAKYELLKLERSHLGSRDSGYNSMVFGPDERGLVGVHLSKELPLEAGRALTLALRKITPQILDWPQYFKAASTVVRRKIWGKDACPAFVPDYTKCIDHFLLHAGGYAVLQAIRKGMGLPAGALMPSFSNLKDMGNTSSSTTWYAWTYLETSTGVKKGERLLQAGVGGGMKSAVAVWVALRDVKETHRAWAHVAGRPYTEADLPRPITVEGTLTGLKNDGRPDTTDDKAAAAAKAAAAGAAAALKAGAPRPATPDVDASDQDGEDGRVSVAARRGAAGKPAPAAPAAALPAAAAVF